jgi:hypothetical protein
MIMERPRLSLLRPAGEDGKSELGPAWADYEECIGAKKHLVLGVSPHIGPVQRVSNSFATG